MGVCMGDRKFSLGGQYRLIRVIGYSYKKVEWIRIAEVTGLESSD